MHHIANVYRKYFSLSGRASLAEFWIFQIFVLGVYCAFLGGALLARDTALFVPLAGCAVVFAIASALPSVAVEVRRLHDINRSGVWWFLGRLPVLNFVVLVFLLLPGTQGDNKYGSPPSRSNPNGRSSGSGASATRKKYSPQQINTWLTREAQADLQRRPEELMKELEKFATPRQMEAARAAMLAGRMDGRMMLSLLRDAREQWARGRMAA